MKPLLLTLLIAPLLAQEPASTPEEPPVLDPAVVTWYQDMRLACQDKRTSIVASHHSSKSSEPGIWTGQLVGSQMARAGLLSWQAANDPRVNDRTLARTPEPADFRPLDSRSSSPSPQLYAELPAEITGRLQAIEGAQAEADTAWRAWQEQPGEEERAALVERLERLQGMCAGL
jgi:hypothetical protein